MLFCSNGCTDVFLKTALSSRDFRLSPAVHWMLAGIACAGAIIGGVAGGLVLKRTNEKVLRLAIVLIGVALTVGLFVRAP